MGEEEHPTQDHQLICIPADGKYGSWNLHCKSNGLSLFVLLRGWEFCVVLPKKFVKSLSLLQGTKIYIRLPYLSESLLVLAPWRLGTASQAACVLCPSMK
jgi:hypothetical protein